jgi:hypothetical protein
VWVTGQAWATINPIQPIEGPPDFAVYPMVFFNTVPTQLNFAYGDPVVSFYPGLTELHAYGQPAVPLVGYFRLEFTLDEGSDPFTIYKLIPHFCDECPNPDPVLLDTDCDGVIDVSAPVQVGSTYRLYRAELAPCGTGVFEILDEFVATVPAYTYPDSGTNGCSYSYLMSVYCPQTAQWLNSDIRTIIVPPPCDLPESFCNHTPIVIPAFLSAAPYPSIITVTGRPGNVVKVLVELFNYHHQFPDDVEILLVSPDGTKVLLMNDVGGSGPNQILVPGINLLITDTGATMPDSTKLFAGTYKPTSPASTDGTFLASPAPAPPFATTMAAFIGGPCNGQWKLFVNDDHGQDSGGIDNGWCLYLPLT